MKSLSHYAILATKHYEHLVIGHVLDVLPVDQITDIKALSKNY